MRRHGLRRGRGPSSDVSMPISEESGPSTSPVPQKRRQFMMQQSQQLSSSSLKSTSLQAPTSSSSPTPRKNAQSSQSYSSPSSKNKQESYSQNHQLQHLNHYYASHHLHGRNKPSRIKIRAWGEIDCTCHVWYPPPFSSMGKGTITNQGYNSADKLQKENEMTKNETFDSNRKQPADIPSHSTMSPSPLPDLTKPRAILVLYHDFPLSHSGLSSSSSSASCDFDRLAGFFSSNGYIVYVITDNFPLGLFDAKNYATNGNDTNKGYPEGRHMAKAGRQSKTAPQLPPPPPLQEEDDEGDHDNLVRYGLSAILLARKRHDQPDVPLYLMGYGMGSVLALAVAIQCQNPFFTKRVASNAATEAFDVSGVVAVAPTLFDVESRDHLRSNSKDKNDSNPPWHRRIFGGFVSSQSLRSSVLPDQNDSGKNQEKDRGKRANTTPTLEESRAQRGLIRHVYESANDIKVPIHCIIAPTNNQDGQDITLVQEGTRTWFDKLSSRDKTWRIYHPNQQKDITTASSSNKQPDTSNDLGHRVERDLLLWLERRRRFRGMSRSASERSIVRHHKSRRLWSDGRTMESLVSSPLTSSLPNATVATRRNLIRSFGNVRRSSSAPSSLGRRRHRYRPGTDSPKPSGTTAAATTTTAKKIVTSRTIQAAGDITTDVASLNQQQPQKQHYEQQQEEKDKQERNDEVTNVAPTIQLLEKGGSSEKIPSTFDTQTGDSLKTSTTTIFSEKQANKNKKKGSNIDNNETKVNMMKSNLQQAQQQQKTTENTECSESLKRLRELAGIDETTFLKDSVIDDEKSEEIDDDATPIKRGDGVIKERVSKRKSQQARRHSLCGVSWSSRSADDGDDDDSYFSQFLGTHTPIGRIIPEER